MTDAFKHRSDRLLKSFNTYMQQTNQRKTNHLKPAPSNGNRNLLPNLDNTHKGQLIQKTHLHFIIYT